MHDLRSNIPLIINTSYKNQQISHGHSLHLHGLKMHDPRILMGLSMDGRWMHGSPIGDPHGFSGPIETCLGAECGIPSPGPLNVGRRIGNPAPCRVNDKSILPGLILRYAHGVDLHGPNPELG